MKNVLICLISELKSFPNLHKEIAISSKQISNIDQFPTITTVNVMNQEERKIRALKKEEAANRN